MNGIVSTQALSGLQVGILPCGVEAGTRLPRVQVTVSDDQGVRISPVERLQQAPQGRALCVRPCVLRLSLLR